MTRLAALLVLLAAPLLAQPNPGRAPLTRGLADALYCQVNGTCTVQTLTITGSCTGCASGLALTSAHLFVGNGSNVATDVALSGDCTLSSSGAITCTKINATTPGGTCTNQVVTSLSTSAVPTCTTITSAYTSGTFSAAAHNLLSATHGDTTAAAAVRGDGLFAIGATPTWQRLAHSSATGGYFKWNGTDVVSSTGAASGTGTCTNQAATVLNADAAPTCSTITSAFVDSSVAQVGAVNAFTGANTYAADQTLGATNCLKWGSSGVATPDTFLCRDAANNVALKNGANVQSLTIYGTTTGPKTLTFSHDGSVTASITANSTANISFVAGTGFTWTENGALSMSYGVAASKTLAPVSDNVNDIGTSSQRFKRIFLGPGGVVGTVTNDSATAGSVGELISGTVVANTTSLSTGTSVNVGTGTNITLTAGDWDCDGAVNFTYGATTSITNLAGGVSTTTGTLPAQDSFFDYETAAQVPTAGAVATWVVPTARVSVAGSTSVFLVTQATFTVSTVKAGGTIRCRRMR